ncbi:AMP-binding protein [Croceitalea rosinachiae]|uniref:AMP-binding protein n=1 Tax=Croceitalea rosinachiae TaxID=3075596 RepID=A0ABU3AB29_9FLAO|nr:AMP-binding protein [Croceitalea sp. F388]MDT0607369.1 AMP-binding protein [Croceitalea sp. F388]
MVHKNFKLNGQSFSQEELIEIGYSLIKEGEEHEISIGGFLLDWFNDSIEIIVQTSGSTGIPKQISLKKSQMVNSALATGNFFRLKPGDSALLCLSADFIAGKMMLVRAIVLGLELDIVAPSSNPLLNNSNTYNFCAMVPMQAKNALENLNQIKTLILGGAAVSSSLKQSLEGLITNCFETYGMTETITHIAARNLSNEKSLDEVLFHTLPNIIISTDNRECLVIDAPKISDSTIVTNDIVELIGDNSFKWLGRFDNIINSGGIKLIPEQIEAKLFGFFENRFFVAGIPDKSLGQKLILIVEGERKYDEIIQSIKSLGLLSKYEIPKEVFIAPSFVETKNGKVDRPKTLVLILQKYL